MQAADLTLDAALRDLEARRPAARDRALRNLAPALLEALGRPGPAWEATHAHPRGSEVRLALHQALRGPDAARAGLAAVGLGWVGDPAVLEPIEPWLHDSAEDDGARFRRECAVVALGSIASAAPSHHPVRASVLRALEAGLNSRFPEVRFQTAAALAELDDASVGPRLTAALAGEADPEVRENLVIALSRLGTLPPEILAVLAALTRDPEEAHALRFEAALILAAAGDRAATPVLLEALRQRLDRDRALEALAALADPAARGAVKALARRWAQAGVTRVRAAYAWARCDPAAASTGGHRLLRRLAWHPRAAVREAVRDAWAGLATLDARTLTKDALASVDNALAHADDALAHADDPRAPADDPRAPAGTSDPAEP